MEENNEIKRLKAKFENFVYLVSHDLKTPLRGIENLCEWIVEDIEDGNEEGVQENLALLQSRVKKMSKMMDVLTEINRVGRLYMDFGKYEIESDINNFLEGFELSPNQVLFDLELKELVTYNVLLGKLLHVIVKNAIQHNETSKLEIKIMNKVNGDQLEWTIQDNGKGVSENSLGRLTDVFYTDQPKDTTESVGGGLALAKEICEFVDSNLEISNNNGLMVRFNWPLNLKKDD